MATFILAGHRVEFADCREVGQSGPETCTMSIDERLVAARSLWRQRARRFHPTPLEHDGQILVPLWEGTRFFLARIDPGTLALARLSRGYDVMRLLRIVGDEAEFSTWWDDRETQRVRLA